jgi:hypothetical protein
VATAVPSELTTRCQVEAARGFACHVDAACGTKCQVEAARSEPVAETTERATANIRARAARRAITVREVDRTTVMALLRFLIL